MALLAAPNPIALATAPADALCTVTASQNGSTALLIRGTILAPDEVVPNGEVLIDEMGFFACVGADCSQDPLAQDATVITCPDGVVSPGLINTHDHLNFNHLYPGVWGDERFDQRHDWRKGLRGHTKISAWSDNDERILTWTEMRQGISGTTSIAAPASGGVSGLARNLDRLGLLDEGIESYTVYNETFPLQDADGVQLEETCRYPEPIMRRLNAAQAFRPNDVYSAHVAEGVDQVAHNTFQCVSGQQPGAMHLTSAKTSFVHLIGLRPPDAEVLGDSMTSLIWSPRSNISLYGATAPVTMFDAMGIQDIAISTDWTRSGSMNLLRELQCADSYNSTHLNGYFSDMRLWEMVTSQAASVLDIGDQIGSLMPGHFGDVAVYDGRDRANPYRAVIEARPEDTLLVLRGGVPLFGEAEAIAALPQQDLWCEEIPGGVCGASRSICLDSNLGYTLAQLTEANEYSYPLFFCDTPQDEPSCQPLRHADEWGCGTYPLDITVADTDGDGVPNGEDNCPDIFNPVLPLDGFYADDPFACLQGDFDADGVGDACDPTPLG
jgi:cytosine/adenosine deaminase-related metal-dependent hydrolase